MDAAHNDLLDVSAIAALFRVTEKSVRDWTNAGMPVAKAGGKGRGKKALYKLAECVEWYFDENFERLQLDRERTRLAAEQAQKIAIENAVRSNAVGELDIWQAELEQLFGEIRAALLAMPTKEAPQLGGDVNQRKDRLEQAVHEILRKLAGYQPGRSTSGDSPANRNGRSAGADASAEADGKPVGGRVSKAVKGKQRGARRVAH